MESNRLWHFDHHTSFLPYFHWLPDDLAFAYSRMSPRANFRERYREPDAASRLHFLRRGRGVSYHEFELALAPVPQLEIVSSLRAPQSAWRGWRQRLSPDRRYESLLARLTPQIPRAFLGPQLDLILRKR